MKCGAVWLYIVLRNAYRSVFHLVLFIRMNEQRYTDTHTRCKKHFLSFYSIHINFRLISKFFNILSLITLNPWTPGSIKCRDIERVLRFEHFNFIFFRYFLCILHLAWTVWSVQCANENWMNIIIIQQIDSYFFHLFLIWKCLQSSAMTQINNWWTQHATLLCIEQSLSCSSFQFHRCILFIFIKFSRLTNFKWLNEWRTVGSPLYIYIVFVCQMLMLCCVYITILNTSLIQEMKNEERRCMRREASR